MKLDSRRRILLCLPGSAEGLLRHPLSRIGKPDSGCTADFTSDGQEPLNREYITCSWFRGSVPESGFSISLSVFQR